MKLQHTIVPIIAAAALCGCSLSSLMGGGGKPPTVLQTLTPEAADPGNLARNAAASKITLSAEDLAEINRLLPAGWAHGYRYNDTQQAAVEQY